MQVCPSTPHRPASFRFTDRRPDLVMFAVALADSNDDEIDRMLVNFPGVARDTDRHGNTALHLAVEAQRSPAVISAILRAGGDPAYANAHGDTALHLLASDPGANPEVASTLLAAGGLALADRRDRQGRSALQRARQDGCPAIVDRLISDIHVLERCEAWRRDRLGATWARYAEGLADGVPLMELMPLVESLGGINAADGRGATVLMRAADEGRVDVAAWLLEFGASVDATFSSARTGLVHGALLFALPSPPMTRLLIAAGADPMQVHEPVRDDASAPRTILQAAAQGAPIESMAALLAAYPAEVWGSSNLGSALLTALEARLPRLAFALLEYSGALDADTMRQARPLAIATGDQELIHLLLALDAQWAPATTSSAVPARQARQTDRTAAADPSAHTVAPTRTPAQPPAPRSPVFTPAAVPVESPSSRRSPRDERHAPEWRSRNCILSRDCILL